jgi:multidrug efflux system membrane fusion protein
VGLVESTEAGRELRFSGVIRAARRGSLAFTMGGRLASRPVAVGDRVPKGQELARLDDLELINGVGSAAARRAELAEGLAQARRDAARADRLLLAKAATREELERATSRVQSLEASLSSSEATLSEARRRLREVRLVAPFAGRVTEVLLQPGEHAVAGAAIVVLAGDGELEVEVEVPETLISKIDSGTEVAVGVPALGLRTEGKIQSLGLTALGPGRLFPLVASFEAPGAVAGMSAELHIRLQNDAALTLAVEAVVDPGGRQPAVFKVVDDVVRRVPVQIGALLDGKVVVDGALSAGDSVVVGGQRGLLDGERVEVLR